MHVLHLTTLLPAEEVWVAQLLSPALHCYAGSLALACSDRWKSIAYFCCFLCPERDWLDKWRVIVVYFWLVSKAAFCWSHVLRVLLQRVKVQSPHLDNWRKGWKVVWQVAILSLYVGSMTRLKALLAHLRPGERRGQESAGPTAPESISSLKMWASV